MEQKSERKPFGRKRDANRRFGKVEKKGTNVRLSPDDKLFLAEIYDKLCAFMKSDEKVLAFDPFNSYQRKLVHDLAVKFGVTSSSEGEGQDRHNVIRRSDDATGEKIPAIDYTKQNLWNFTKEYLVPKSKIGTDIILSEDGSVICYANQPENMILDRKKVTSGSFKIINSKIVESTDRSWR